LPVRAFSSIEKLIAEYPISRQGINRRASNTAEINWLMLVYPLPGKPDLQRFISIELNALPGNSVLLNSISMKIYPLPGKPLLTNFFSMKLNALPGNHEPNHPIPKL
jgi:hypothetical protein